MKDSIGLIQQYNSNILPKIRGESVVVENIGLIQLGDNYENEALPYCNLYKITKK